MKRPLAVVAATALVGGLALLPASGGAQTPGATTLSLFEADAGARFQIVDNAPRSPVRNPGSRRFRFSLGDQFVFSNPLLDRRGGTRVGTLYVNAVVVKGRTFRDAVVLGEVVWALNDGSQITGQGTFSFADDTAEVAIVGGTRTYAGARGSATSQTVRGGSQDTLTLLP